MDKVKLGVNVSKELNEELISLINQVNNLVRILKDHDVEIPLTARNKGELVEELLWQSIKVNQQKLFELFKVNLSEEYEERGDSLMKTEIAMPSQELYKKAMVEILNNRHNKECTSQEMYELMAEHLKLTNEQVDAVMPKDKRNWHENKCQWARNDLKKDGVLDENTPRGVWRLV